MTLMINGYRSAVRFPPAITNDIRVKVLTLMMWGIKEVAHSYRLARPGMDYVDEGNLILFPEATHWVHLEAAEEVNHYLVDFVLDKVSQIAIR